MSIEKLDELVKTKNEVVFDLDETLGKLLIDWSEFGWRFRDRARNFDSEMVNKHSPELSETISLIFQLINKHGAKAKELVDEFWGDWEDKYYKGVKENKNLVEWIKKKEGLNYYVWTSNRRKTALMAVESLGLSKVFRKIVTADEVGNFKPSSDGFDLIRDPKISLDKYLLVGDSKWDELAAREVEIDFVNVNDLRWER